MKTLPNAPAAPASIDLDVRVAVRDGARRFDLAVRLAVAASTQTAAQTSAQTSAETPAQIPAQTPAQTETPAQTQPPVVALFGPSGAGKSLTLQCIAGLLRPDAGHVRIGGRTLFDAAQGVDEPAQRRGVGYLFQDYALFPHLTVRQNIAFGLTTWWQRRPRADSARRVEALLDGFGLTDMASSRPRALSGGQRQRVALARALACAPQVLLLDEPFAALNPMLRRSLRLELRATCQRWQIPVIMVTHDLDDVLALADTAFVIEHGQAVREVDVRRAQARELARQLLPETQTQAHAAAAAADPAAIARDEAQAAHARRVRTLLETGSP